MPTTTTLTNGEIVVPMSTLLDALKDVLNEQERQALFSQLLGLRPQRVAPGDLITADAFNRILDDINELMMRVASLEANSDTSVIPPRINSILPQIVRAGEEITVTGQGLSAVNIQSLRFDNNPVPISSVKAGSSSTKLIINAPALIGLPKDGKVVVLSITNGAGSAQGTYTELPGVSDSIQTKISFVEKGILPLEKLKPDTEYTLTVEATISASAAETFDVIGSIDGAGFKVSDISPKTVTATEQSAVAPVKQTIKIKVVTGPSGSGNFTLSLKGKTYVDAIGAMTSPVEFKIDAQTDLPSDKIKFDVPTVIGPHGIDLSGNVPRILFAKAFAATPVTLTLPVTLVDGGKMKVQNIALTPLGMWSAQVKSDLNVSLNPNIGSSLVLTITPSLTGGQPASLTGTILFEVTNADGTQKRPFQATISVL